MFGMKRKQAVNNASQAVGQLVNLCQAFSDLPSGFWRDPYVLGFLTTTIAVFAEMTLGKKPGAEEMGFIIMGVYERLNPLQAKNIAHQIVALQEAKEANYFRAVEKAYKTIAVTYGHPGFENDPDVIDAARLASAMRGAISISNPNAELGGALQSMLFIQVVKERLRAEGQS